jgi:hypothetical protein
MKIFKETLLQYCLAFLMVFYFQINVNIAYGTSIFDEPVYAVIIILINYITAYFLAKKILK